LLLATPHAETTPRPTQFTGKGRFSLIAQGFFGEHLTKQSAIEQILQLAAVHALIYSFCEWLFDLPTGLRMEDVGMHKNNDQDRLTSHERAVAETVMQTLIRAIAPRQEEINKPAGTNTGHTVCSATRKCAYCGTTSTSLWRRGPENYTNLCNSCGVKWRRGKITLSSGDNQRRLWKS
jgi:hypothetical protein